MTAAGSEGPFSLLLRLFGDPAMADCWGEAASIRAWIKVEMALAGAQGAAGVIPLAAAEDIRLAGRSLLEQDSLPLWSASANVGYPILPLVRTLNAATESEGDGRVHLGATTQDIMDSGLALQLRDASDILLRHLEQIGDALSELVQRYAATPMAGRTHAQQAVPTTFGLKLAVFLRQFQRIGTRIAQDSKEASTISLFGAAGTSAALKKARVVRSHMARELGLTDTTVPWHVARDFLFQQLSNVVLAAQVSARLAKEVIDLSRTEIREVAEIRGVHRGASSTMPQKANPILSEAIVGLAATVSSMLPAAARAVEAGHERAAGEWQIEWHVVPQIFTLSSSALLRVTELLSGLSVDTDAMARNMQADNGLLMAEAYMMALSPILGREQAHDEVSAACLVSREQDLPLGDALARRLPARMVGALTAVRPDEYVGEARDVCDLVVNEWRKARLNGERT